MINLFSLPFHGQITTIFGKCIMAPVTDEGQGGGSVSSQQAAADNGVNAIGRTIEQAAADAECPEWVRNFAMFDDLNESITRPDFRLAMNGVEIMPKGEITAVSGKPGVGKSSVLAIVIGLLMSGRTWGGLRCVTPAKRCLWIDTEKGEYSCKIKAGYLRAAAGFGYAHRLADHGVDFARLREFDTAKKIKFISARAKAFQYDLIVIDGLIDLMAGDKSTDDTTALIELLQSLTVGGTSVIVMLHSNKSRDDDNMRYAIGTEVWRICTTWLKVSYDEDKRQHSIELMKSNDTGRAYPVFFAFDDDGNPKPITKDPATILKEVFADGKPREWTKLWNEVAVKGGIPKGQALDFCKIAQRDNLILQNEDDCKFILAPSKTARG